MSYRKHRIRILLGALLFASVVFAPWWVSAAVAIAIAARWRAWEVVAVGIFMDMYWLPVSVDVHHLPLATIAAFLIVILLEPLRRQLLVGPIIE